jgi:hypothetical protein
MLELVGYASYAGYKATLGYVKTGKESGWGSAANYGDTVVPFKSVIISPFCAIDSTS